MKKITIFILLTIGIFSIIFLFAGHEKKQGDAREYLRVHIRANSNSSEDQSVKYLVRDGVIEFLTPVVAECASKELAIKLIRERLDDISFVTKNILQKSGFIYGAKATIKKEKFPTRVYEGATLPAGEYDALILELGTGEGDNWWCVVYPPLCFTSSDVGVVYRSKILEILRTFFQRSG